MQFLTNVLRQDMEVAGDPLAPQAARIERAISAAAGQTRQVARGMNPVVADGAGLMHALRELAAETARVRQVACTFHCPPPVSIENPTTANELFRIAQEAAFNAGRHSHAKRITLRLRETRGEIELAVVDNGRGLPADLGKARGMGLRVMQYRAGIIGGRLAIEPRRRGGTEVICRIPKTATTV